MQQSKSLRRFQQPRSRRREYQSPAGHFPAFTLQPLCAVPFMGSESGTVRQAINLSLNRIQGGLLTEIHAEVVCVYVPALAAYELLNESDPTAGYTEAFRQMLLSGQTPFPLEEENDISKHLGVQPRSVNGQKMVSSLLRVAHNCAVNHLRRMKHEDAETVPASNLGVTNALLSSTILERFNAVLDPDNRINGAVSLSGKLPVQGLGLRSDTIGITADNPALSRIESDGEVQQNSQWGITGIDDTAGNYQAQLFVQEDPDNPGQPNIHVDFGNSGMAMTLEDFYNVKRVDSITRSLRQIMDEHSSMSDDIIAKMSYGLHVEVEKEPFVAYQRRWRINRTMSGAMDGAGMTAEIQVTDNSTQHEWALAVPANEFGGVLITFVQVTPDEVLDGQPHPILTAPWEQKNFLAEEVAKDPVPVAARELTNDFGNGPDQIPVNNETTTMMYTGLNEMYRNYTNYGFTRATDMSQVENKNSVWQYPLPVNGGPANVVYPDGLEQTPFIDTVGDACKYNFTSATLVNTPMIYGPTPIENLPELTDELLEIDEDV